MSDDLSKITVCLLSKTSSALVANVSLGCRRLMHSLLSAPASMTAGTATMKCLQPQRRRSGTVISAPDLMDGRKAEQENSRSGRRAVYEDPV